MTSRWGPTYWNYIHMVSLHYSNHPTKQEMDNNFNLVQNFMNTLPCDKCKKEIKKLVTNKDLQLSLENRDKFVKYFWNIHNSVNKRLNKRRISLKEFYKLYESKKSLNLFKLIKSNKLKNIVITILLIIVLILCILLYKRR